MKNSWTELKCVFPTTYPRPDVEVHPGRRTGKIMVTEGVKVEEAAIAPGVVGVYGGVHPPQLLRLVLCHPLLMAGFHSSLYSHCREGGCFLPLYMLTLKVSFLAPVLSSQLCVASLFLPSTPQQKKKASD